MPFISKTVGIDFIEMATKFILNYPVEEDKLQKLSKVDGPKSFVGVKVPMFSWPRLRGAVIDLLEIENIILICLDLI